MPKLTIKDIRNPARRSGFDHVGVKLHPSRPGRPRPFQAQSGPRRGADDGSWYGPARSTAEEAAQDYVDYMNGRPVKRPQGTSPTKVHKLVVNLNSAGHKSARRRPSKPRRGRRPQKIGYVYCIGEENNAAAVKVGYASDATLRIGSLQTGNPRKLVILGVLRGTRADERELHAEYQHDNILGEWFRPTPELLSEFEIDMEMIA